MQTSQVFKTCDVYVAFMQFRFFKLVLLGFTLSLLWRMVLALREMGSIPEIAFSPPPLYIAITSGVWALIFAACLGAVLLNLRWGALAAILAGVLNQAHVWLDRLLFSRSTESMQTLGFAAILSALFLILLCVPAAHFYARQTSRLPSRLNGNN